MALSDDTISFYSMVKRTWEPLCLAHHLQRAIKRIAGADRHFNVDHLVGLEIGAGAGGGGDGSDANRMEAMRSAVRSSSFSRRDARRRCHLLDNFLGGVPPRYSTGAMNDSERVTLLSVEKLHRQLLSSDNNADPAATRRDICNQLCGLLDRTWEEDTTTTTRSASGNALERPTSLTFWGVLRATLHAFALCSPDMPDVSSIKRLRIHMAAALLRADATAVDALEFVPPDFASRAQQWRRAALPLLKTPSVAAPEAVPETTAAMTAAAAAAAAAAEDEENQGGRDSSDSWGSEGWGSDAFSGSEDGDGSIPTATRTSIDPPRPAAAARTAADHHGDRQLRVPAGDTLGTSLQREADAIVDIVVRRLLETGSACASMKDPNFLVTGASASSYTSLVGRVSRHIFDLYANDRDHSPTPERSGDLRPLADYSVQSAIKSGASLVAGALAGFFGGGGRTPPETSSSEKAAQVRAHHRAIVIFVVGGVCASEIAEVNDAFEQSGGLSVDSVIVGSTCLLQPDEVMHRVFM